MAFGLGAALAGIGALAKGISGVSQAAKANKIDRQNIRPVERVQAEYFQNVAEAQSMAQGGIPAAQYNLARQNINRNQTGVLRTLGRSANPGAGLASVLRASNDASLNLDAQNASVRQQNQRFLMGQRGVLAQQKQNAFDWNEKSQYLAQASKAQALRGAGAQNLMGAFGDVTQLGMMAADPMPGQGANVLGIGGGFFPAMNKYGSPNYNTRGGVNS